MRALPPADRQQAGASAEDAALAFLQAEGLVLLARNARYPFGEIDLVMRDEATLVFVEVRFRRPSRFGGGALSVDATKRRKIARASQAWLSSHKQYSEAGCRFDVVAALPGGNGIECEWIRAAFTLDDLW
ncbi:MAG: YraN family protein [Gammaproteobacteria bacterium]|nr:YraN family protein [Gammaproteobacteria bacterium]